MDAYITSNNQSLADNQQGRLDPWYIVGFTDGEGCFSISIFRNKTTRLGFQVFPKFVLTQGAKSVEVLHAIQSYFGCGNVYRNSRTDNHREDLYRYCVRSILDLQNMILPFFAQYPLKTNKRFDYESFCVAVEVMSKKGHLDSDGLEYLRTIAATMNRKISRN